MSSTTSSSHHSLMSELMSDLSSGIVNSSNLHSSGSSMSSMMPSKSNNRVPISIAQQSFGQSSQKPLEKLRIIKPFEEKQLLNFYKNSLLDGQQKFSDYFHEHYYERTSKESGSHNEYFDLIIRLDKSGERFNDIRFNILEFLEQIREKEQKKTWHRSVHHLHQTDRCGDGQLVQAKQQYEIYHLDTKCLQTLDRLYYLLRERLVNEHVVHSYFQKYFQLRFELVVHEASNIIKRLERKLSSISIVSGESNYDLQQASQQQSLPSQTDSAAVTDCGSIVFDDDGSLSTITQIYNDPSCRMLKEQLLDLMAALFGYYRRTVNQKEHLKRHCFEAIVHLWKKQAKIATFQDRLFLLNQILRCPAGSSKDFGPLLEPLNPLPLKMENQYDAGKQYVDYGVATISTILSPIQKPNVQKNNLDIGMEPSKDSNDQLTTGTNNANNKMEAQWLLVDIDLEDEVVDSSLADITENDIITYLSRVPFREMLQFMSLVNDENSGKDTNSFPSTDDEQMQITSTETAMIRLFAFNTRLIQIFRAGLQNFNCLRFKRLTLYLASMIKQIIKTISDNWRWCKGKFTTTDQALLIRLQVEFDHFMLRSIMAVLSTNRRGIWPLLAKIDFEGISEPMLWHILWVVYNNGRNNEQLNEMVTGLCPYMSANYWKDKFRTHVQWKYVFIEKLSILSLEEASGLIDFFYNMAISRSFEHNESMWSDNNENGKNQNEPEIQNQSQLNDNGSCDDFLREILERFGEICLLKKFYHVFPDSIVESKESESVGQHQILVLNNQEFYSTKGVACMIKLVSRFKQLLLVLMQFIQAVKDDNLLHEPCFDLFTSITIDDWKPDQKFLSILYKWLLDTPIDNAHNRFARILLTKIGWNHVLAHTDHGLLIPVQQQQQFALKIHQAIQKHFGAQNSGLSPPNQTSTTQIKYPIIEAQMIDNEQQRLAMAQSTDLQQFGQWCWSMLLSLRLHPLDLIPDESSWDDIVHENSNKSGYRRRNRHWTMQAMMKFNYDSEMVSISRGIELENPYSIYIASIMSDLLFNGTNIGIDLKRMTELIEILAKYDHFVPILHLLYHFLPFTFENDGELRSNLSFIRIILTLLERDFYKELCSIILLQRKHFSVNQHAQMVCQAWTEVLFEAMNKCLNYKNNSWLSSFGFLSSSSTSVLTVIDKILVKITTIFDHLCMDLLLENEGNLKLYLQYLTRKLYGRMINWKLSQLDSLSNVFLSISSSSSTSLTSTTSSNSAWLSSWYSFSSGNTEPVIHYLPDKNLIRSPWMSPLHLLLRHCLNNVNGRTHKPVYLAFLLTEADIRRTSHIWNYLISELNKRNPKSNNSSTTANVSVVPSNTPQFFDHNDLDFIEKELSNACQMYDKAPLPLQMLPINLLTTYLVKFVPLEQNLLKYWDSCPHPLTPLLWRQFFSNYFLYTDYISTIGNRWFIDSQQWKMLNDRLNALFDYHNHRWICLNNEQPKDSVSVNSESTIMNPQQTIETASSDSISSILFENRLVKLYRAYRIWLKDNRFQQYADLDDEQFSKPEIQIKLLASVVACSKILAQGPQSDLNLLNENHWLEFDRLNSFFCLNYLQKLPLVKMIAEYEQRWLRIVKPNLNERSILIEEEDDEDNEKQSLGRNVHSFDSSNEIGFLEDRLESFSKQDSDHHKMEYQADSDRFPQIIDYFTKLTSTLNCNILFLNDDIGYNLMAYNDDDEELDHYGVNNSLTVHKSEQDISVAFVIIHQIVDNIVEEARFVENQLEKFTTLNQEFGRDILPKLYHEVNRELIQKIFCDRQEFDASGCNKPAMIKFEFTESISNNYVRQKYDKNRTEFDSIINSLMKDIPGQKVVASIYFMQKIGYYLLRFFDGSDPKSEFNQQRINRLFETMSGWINSINLIGVKYHITGQLLDIFLDLLNKLSEHYIDEVNYFYLNTALQRSVSLPMIQQLAPCLAPSKTSPLMFIEMYKLIGSRLKTTGSQQTIFVLLSKFDVNAWLQLHHLQDEQRLDLLNCLFQCFAFFGTNPSDEFLITYDLYRKHLQDMILYRFPLFMPHIIGSMLQGMADQVLAPALWNSILHTFGFYTKSLSFLASGSSGKFSPQNSQNESKLEDNKNYRQHVPTLMDFDFKTFDDDLRTYLLRQKLFTSHELYDLMQMMIQFKQYLREQEEFHVEFLDHFKIYNAKFLQYLTFVSYCWINSNAASIPNDLSIVWNPFFENWKYWLFPKQNTKFIQSEHYSFAWQLFINSVQFMLDTFFDGQSQILSCLWEPFMAFVLETRSLERSDVEMFESKLLQITSWSQFYPSMTDMKLMYESVLMNRYSLERLNAYVISKLKWTEVLLHSPLITVENAVEILENLTYTIISLAEQPFIEQVDFQQIPFWLLPCEKVKKIVLTLLEVMKKRISVDIVDSIGYSSSKIKSKKETNVYNNQLVIIVRLLKSLVQLSPNDSSHNEMATVLSEDEHKEPKQENFQQQPNYSQKSSKVIYYAHCIGSFVSYICNQNVDYVAKHPETTRMFLKDAVESLRPTIDGFESSDRVSIFCELLQALNEIHDTPIRDRLSTHFVTIFSYMTSQQMFAEIMFAIGKIIYSIKTSVYLLECLIENYFDLSGDLNFLVDNLEIVHLNKHITNSNSNTGTSQPPDATGAGSEIEDFILESIKTRSCLLLLVYVHRRLRHRTVPDICTRRYVYNILQLCSSHFKLGNIVNNNLPSNSPTHTSTSSVDEGKITFFWLRLFDLMTFDHSALHGTMLNISIHHLSSLRTTPTPVGGQLASSIARSTTGSSRSLIESPIIYANQNSSIILSDNHQFSSSLPLPSTSKSATPPPSSKTIAISSHHQLTLNIHDENVWAAIQTLLMLCTTLNSSISDSLNRGFFGLFRQQKIPSQNCLFLLQCLILHGVCTMLETFFPEMNNQESGTLDDKDSKTKSDLAQSNSEASSSQANDNVRNKLKMDLKELVHSGKNRLRTWKKNKNFQELWPSIDKILNLTKPPVVVKQSSNESSENRKNFSQNTSDNSASLLIVEEDQLEDGSSLDGTDDEYGHDHANSFSSIESVTKQWLRYYIRLTEYQQKRFHTIQRCLLECYNDHNFMKHFI